MCGLALAANKGRNVGQRVFELYTQQKHRGKEGFGYIAIQDGKIVGMQKAKYEEIIKPRLLKEEAELVLFHHRLPTSTENTVGTAHPIFVSNAELEYDYYVMHNGCVSNDDELKAKHEELGYQYTTEFQDNTYAVSPSGAMELLSVGKKYYNDSESLAIEAARFIEGLDSKMNNKGAAAFFAVQVVKGSKDVACIYYAQNYGRKLGFKKKKGWTIVASEHGKEVPQMKMYALDPKTMAVTESELDMDDAMPSTPSPYQQNMGFSRVVTQEDKNPYDLKNALYTYEEAQDSGAPMSDFYTSESMYVDGKWQVMRVPAIFAGKGTTGGSVRPLFRDEYYYLPEPSVDKAQERLEELAMKFARKQHEFDYLEHAYVFNKISKEDHSKRKSKLQNELEELEDFMSSLGLDSAVVEETVQTAQEMVAYEYQSR